jgi:hypothetical protein
VNGTKNQDECRYVLDASDQHFQSWTYWDWDFYTPDYQVDYFKLNLFSRVYPSATNGIPQIMFYNATTRYFLYVYETNITSANKAELATEIFVPLHLYPNGYDVYVSDNLKWDFDQDSSKIFVYLADEIVDYIKKTGEPYFNDECKVALQSK